MVPNRFPSAHYALWRIKKMVRDRRGVSALEFAVVAPILVLLYVGFAEIATALTIYRRTSMVASTAADLTAQVKSVTKSDIRDIQEAASSILTPYPTKPLKVVLTSVVADEDNNGKVEWSCATQGVGRAEESRYPVPTGLTEPDSSVIVAEITYSFKPLVGLTEIFSPGAFDMKRTFYARPRKSLAVEKTDNGC